MDYQKELSYLLSIPSDEIIRVILEEAVKDLKITKEEQYIIDGVRNDLSNYSSTFTLPGSSKITKTGLQLLLIQQRSFLRSIVTKTYKRLSEDNLISEDENKLYRVLVNKVDEVIATKIGMFLSLNLEEPHFLMLHKTIGEQFTNLCASIILDIYCERVNNTQRSFVDLESLSREFNSELTQKEFVIRFQKSLQKLSEMKISSPSQLIQNLNSLIQL
ncbi:hypothetical protein [Candidatus Hodarchaeum mangrovi]